MLLTTFIICHGKNVMTHIPVGPKHNRKGDNSCIYDVNFPVGFHANSSFNLVMA